MSNTQLDVTANQINDACRKIAEAFYGRDGLWLFDCYNALNEQLFFGELPTALVTLELTAHGRCLGLTYSGRLDQPKIKIHPSTFGGSEKPNPWNVPETHLGWRYALDVLIHEMAHVSVAYRLGGTTGPTSHNDPQWCREIERLAPLIGISGFKASTSKLKRIPTGRLKENGRPETTVKRVAAGAMSYAATYSFPHTTRRELGDLDYYIHGSIDLDLPNYP